MVTKKKQYISLVSQEGSNVPTESIISNDLDLKITWERISRGIIQGNLSRPVNISLTTVSFELQEYNMLGTGGLQDSLTLKFRITDTPNVDNKRDDFKDAVLIINEYFK